MTEKEQNSNIQNENHVDNNISSKSTLSSQLQHESGVTAHIDNQVSKALETLSFDSECQHNIKQMKDPSINSYNIDLEYILSVFHRNITMFKDRKYR